MEYIMGRIKLTLRLPSLLTIQFNEASLPSATVTFGRDSTNVGISWSSMSPKSNGWEDRNSRGKRYQY